MQAINNAFQGPSDDLMIKFIIHEEKLAAFPQGPQDLEINRASSTVSWGDKPEPKAEETYQV